MNIKHWAQLSFKFFIIIKKISCFSGRSTSASVSVSIGEFAVSLVTPFRNRKSAATTEAIEGVEADTEGVAVAVEADVCLP